MLKMVLFLSVLFFSPQLSAHEWQNNRADSHAPLGVMGDHTHNVGKTMFSYRYMTMSMDGNRSGQSQRSVSEVLTDFMVAPLNMTMRMHMFGIMYAPTDKLTLMTMLPYINKSMDHRKRDLTEFNRKSNGIGDLKIEGLYQLFKDKDHSFHINTGVSLPLGSIDKKDGQATRLPYPMQLGSGTYGIQLGGTYVKQWTGWSVGSQVSGLFRLDKNKHEYALGNVYTGTAWVSKLLTDSISTSFRTQVKIWDDINGSDSDLNPNMVSTAQTNRGGKQLDLAMGLNYLVREGWFKGNRLGFEFGMPLIQSLDSVQLETDWWVSIGWQYTP